MWIAFLITEPVMLAVYGYPLLGYHACGQPQPGSHEVFKDGMKLYASMCLATV
jgi:hypothetical protein